MEKRKRLLNEQPKTEKKRKHRQRSNWKTIETVAMELLSFWYFRKINFTNCLSIEISTEEKCDKIYIFCTFIPSSETSWKYAGRLGRAVENQWRHKYSQQTNRNFTPEEKKQGRTNRKISISLSHWHEAQAWTLFWGYSTWLEFHIAASSSFALLSRKIGKIAGSVVLSLCHILCIPCLAWLVRNVVLLHSWQGAKCHCLYGLFGTELHRILFWEFRYRIGRLQFMCHTRKMSHDSDKGHLRVRRIRSDDER